MIRHTSFYFHFFYLQKEGETSDLEKGAVKAVQDLYDIVRHDVLSINMRLVILFSMCLYLQSEICL